MCWFDPECEATSAPDHKDEDHEHLEGEFDVDNGEVAKKSLGVKILNSSLLFQDVKAWQDFFTFSLSEGGTGGERGEAMGE